MGHKLLVFKAIRPIPQWMQGMFVEVRQEKIIRGVRGKESKEIEKSVEACVRNTCPTTPSKDQKMGSGSLDHRPCRLFLIHTRTQP